MRLCIRAHFNGTVIVPDEPLEIPANRPLTVHVTVDPPPLDDAGQRRRDAAIDRFLSKPVAGADIPNWALTREHLYDDRT